MVSETGDYELSLILDGLYFAEAREASKTISKLDAQYARTEKLLKQADRKILDIESKYRTRDDAYDETETLCIQSEQHWDSFQRAAAKLVRTSAMIHLLCANCLEAHINILAQSVLSRTEFDEFDKLSLFGKWLFYPEIRKIDAFKVGEQPLQGLAQLIKIRNALVHFKGVRCRREFGFQVPDFVERLRLRKSAVEDSLHVTSKLVTHLARVEGRKTPEWLSVGWEAAILTVTPAFSF